MRNAKEHLFLVADDDHEWLELVEDALSFINKGRIRVVRATTPKRVRQVLEQQGNELTCVILDINFNENGGDRAGLELLREIKVGHPNLFVTMFTFLDDSQDIVEACKSGADNYITKGAVPLQTDLTLLVQHCEKHIGKLELEAQKRSEVRLVGGSDNILSICSSIDEIRQNQDRFDRYSKIAVIGPSGSGKRAVVDYWLGRKIKRVFNCGSVSEGNISFSKLFGYAANSGLNNSDPKGKPGLFEEAKGDWILLDDFQELLTPSRQHLFESLLHVLDHNEVIRQCDHQAIPVDFKLAITSQKPLTEYPAQIRGRLKGIGSKQFFLQPLCERVEDVEPLIEFTREQIKEHPKLRFDNVPKFDVEVIDHFKQLAKDGVFSEENVRGISDAAWKLIEKYPEKNTISMEEVDVCSFDEPRSESYKISKKEAFENFYRDYLMELMAKHDGDVKEVAAELDCSGATVRRHAEKHKVPVGRDFRAQKKQRTANV